MDTSLEFVHLAILKDAADIANERYTNEFDPANPQRWRPGRFRNPPGQREGFVFGDIYRPDPVQSEKGGLTLTIDPHAFRALDVAQQARARQIGIDAIREAIVKNKEQFVGLILGEARQGRNYFDRFSPDPQLRLF